MAAAAPSWSQEWAADMRLSRDAAVSMVTIYPGESLYSMYGHTAIRIIDDVQDLDILYNYGQASVPFDSGFVPKFVSGDLSFILGVSDTGRAFQFYREYEDRSIYEQELNLTDRQKQAVFNYLAENAKEENRTYIYDFFFDNCTTRVRDLFHDVFGEELRFSESAYSGDERYRTAISPYLRGVPYVKLGIDLMFGRTADEHVAAEKDLFLPLQLMDAVEKASLGTGNISKDLVLKSGFLYNQQRAESEPPPFGPAGLFWIVCAAAAAIISLPWRFPRIARIIQSPMFRRFQRVLDWALFFLTGAVGTSAVLLWAFSGYEMTYWNFNILWAWPTHLFAAFFFLRKNKTADPGSGGSGPFAFYLKLNSMAILIVFVLSILTQQDLPFGAIPLMITLILRNRQNRIEKEEEPWIAN